MVAAMVVDKGTRDTIHASLHIDGRLSICYVVDACDDVRSDRRTYAHIRARV